MISLVFVSGLIVGAVIGAVSVMCFTARVAEILLTEGVIES